jgi:hypothetical protein
MLTHAITGLLNRRGAWMTAHEVFEASPDYPLGEYVNADLAALKVNGLIVSRLRKGTSLIEYGLPGWVSAPEPAFSLRYFLHTVGRLLGLLAAGLQRG